MNRRALEWASNRPPFFVRCFTLGLLAALVCGGLAAALPPDDFLQNKVIEVGQALGLREAYQDRMEGLFIWRISLPFVAGGPPMGSCDGFFAWYLKTTGDTVALDDPAALPGCHADRPRAFSEIQALQKEFTRRWLAAVGPVAITSPTAQSHEPRLVGAVFGLLSGAPDAYQDRGPPPPPPEGFAWRELPEINAAVLIPDNWSFKREVGRGKSAMAYFVSVENIEAKGSFQTGLSLNVLVDRSPSVNAEAYAKTLIAQVGGQKGVQVLRPPAERTDGAFHNYDCLVRIQGTTGPLVAEHRAIVNVKTKTTYVLTFESPEPGWKNAWVKGARIEELLLLDDDL